MAQDRRILYILLGCFFALAVIALTPFTTSTAILPAVLDLLSFMLLIISVVSLVRRPSQQKQAPGKTTTKLRK